MSETIISATISLEDSKYSGRSIDSASLIDRFLEYYSLLEAVKHENHPVDKFLEHHPILKRTGWDRYYTVRTNLGMPSIPIKIIPFGDRIVISNFETVDSENQLSTGKRIRDYTSQISDFMANRGLKTIITYERA